MHITFFVFIILMFQIYFQGFLLLKGDKKNKLEILKHDFAWKRIRHVKCIKIQQLNAFSQSYNEKCE